MDYTTIQISKTTREKLNDLRTYKRMTYDELLNALMSLIPEIVQFLSGCFTYLYSGIVHVLSYNSCIDDI